MHMRGPGWQTDQLLTIRYGMDRNWENIMRIIVDGLMVFDPSIGKATQWPE
jgi:hypothetical protein